MPAPTGLQFLGDSTLKTGEFRVHFGTKGMSTHFRVFSPNIANLVNYLNNVITPAGGTGVISGSDGGQDRMMEIEVPGLTSNMVGVLNEVFFDQWELMTNETTDSIFANPLLVTGSPAVLNYNDKVVLSRLSRDGGAIADAVSSCNGDIGNGLQAPTGGNYDGGNNGQFQAPTLAAALQLAVEIQKGQTEYEAPGRVLRHTSYCSPTSFYNSSVAREEYIYTTSELLTEISSGWTYNCPQRIRSKISSIPIQFAPAAESAYYTWGWRKLFSRETVLPSFLIEVNTEYVLGLWSNLRYATF